MDDTVALVIFTDVRGFTLWSKDNEVFANLADFVGPFINIIKKYFPKPAFVKPLGDGALVVQELDRDPSKHHPAKLLTGTLKTLKKVEDEFVALCQEFGRTVGHATDLRLGWGVVRGKIMRVNGDYAGSNLNKCARLCALARPFGIVADQADFPDEPASKDYQFYPQTRRILDVGEVKVWVTKEIESQFLTRESVRQDPEVHVAGICVDASSKKGLRLLLARRLSTRGMFPNKIEGCGGQLARSETFAAGVRRHFRLEMGIEVKVLTDIHCFYEIVVPNEPLIPGIRFLCEQVDEKTPTSKNHSEAWWATETAFRAIPADEFVGEMKEEVLGLLKKYKASL